MLGVETYRALGPQAAGRAVPMAASRAGVPLRSERLFAEEMGSRLASARLLLRPVLKRTLDIAGALALLVALSPVLFQLPDHNLSNAPEVVTTAGIGWTPAIGTRGLTGLVYPDLDAA